MRARDERNALRKLSTRNSQSGVFVRRKGKRARAGALLEHLWNIAILFRHRHPRRRRRYRKPRRRVSTRKFGTAPVNNRD